MTACGLSLRAGDVSTIGNIGWSPCGAQRSQPVATSGKWDGTVNDPGDNEDNIAWVRETSREIGEFGAGTYLNFTGLAEEDPAAGVANAFGPNLERLAEMSRSTTRTTSSSVASTT
jgi:hypothetical protein